MNKWLARLKSHTATKTVRDTTTKTPKSAFDPFAGTLPKPFPGELGREEAATQVTRHLTWVPPAKKRTHLRFEPPGSYRLACFTTEDDETLVKVSYESEGVAVPRRPRTLPLEELLAEFGFGPGMLCRWCGRGRWWNKASGESVCTTCHPDPRRTTMEK